MSYPAPPIDAATELSRAAARVGWRLEQIHVDDVRITLIVRHPDLSRRPS